MKKLMISTIILLPLLILAIMLVSGAIMSLVTHIYVESIEFVQDDTLVLVLKDEAAPPSAKCEVNILPLKATNRDIVFESKDQSIVTIDSEGVVTAKYFGETYVTVSSKENKAAVAQRKVLVTDNEVHSVKIQPFVDNMYNGDSQRLTVKVLPEEANDQSITWLSSDENVLTVSSTGEVVCRGAGTATVTARSKAKPEVEDVVTIHCFQQLKSISVDGPQEELVTGLEADFPKIVPTPLNATYTVEYSSTNEDVATVDKATGHITFKHAGYVIITATASDVKGNKSKVSVSYHCTDGYFEIGSLFGDKLEYAYDYDANANKPLDIKLNIVKDVAYREIVSVSYKHNDKTYNSKDGDKFALITFDEATNTFTLNSVGDDYPLGTVEITVNAKKYSVDDKRLIETHTDKCTVTITRKTKSIKFIDENGDTPAQTVALKDLTFADATKTGSVASGIGIILAPANHTDDYLLSVASGDATISENKYLRFAKEGEVTVKAYIDGNEDVNAKLTLSYLAPKPEEKRIEVTEEGNLPNVNLNFTESGADTCYLDIKPPAGKEAKYVSNNKEVVDFDNDTVRLVAKKGGFATVTITFVPIQAAVAYASRASEASEDEIILKIYVDKPVGLNDVTITPTLERTQENSVGYTVVFAVDPDAMEGKEVYIDGQKATAKDGNVLEYVGTHNFANKTENITVAVRYAEVVKEYDAEKTGEIFTKDHAVETTRGNLKNAPTLKVGGKAFDGNISFGNIGDKITLDIEATLDPTDFTLDEKKIYFSEADNIDKFTSQVTVKDNAHATVTLTATKTLGTATPYYLNIAGHSFTLNVKIDALADQIKLEYDPGKGMLKALSDGTTYNTLLKNLTFKATISRADGEEITVKGFTYSFGDGEHPVIKLEDTITLENLKSGETTLTVKTGRDTTFTVTIDRHSLDQNDFETFVLQYPFDNGTKQLDAFSFSDGATQKINFPAKFQGAFELVVNVPELEGEDVFDGGNVFKGFDLTSVDEEITNLFKVTFDDDVWENRVEVLQEADAWTIKYYVETPSGGEAFKNKVMRFACGENSVTLSLSRVELVRIEFDGFDMGDKSNGGDVYKGYQQVRVFAKHSDFGDGKGKVDYIRVPVNALSEVVFNTPADPLAIKWTLTKYNSKDGTHETLVQQDGLSVTYKQNGYTIEKGSEGHSVLKDADEKIIAQNGVYQSGAEQVPWVDAFAENGYAHIYFGNFVGLSEVDVQNDYFGNFAEEEGWTKPNEVQNDNSGRNFTPSGGAFSYLRVDAGDGEEVNAHFNFNVLQDDADALVNVYNATGYYANNKIVLHENLYGPGELGTEGENFNKATANDLFLNNSSGLGKTTIYGNGYQVNFEAKNAELVKAGDKGTSNGVHVQKAINTTIKASTPTEIIDKYKHVVVLEMQYAYYCDVEYYSKISPWGAGSSTPGYIYLKNTALRCAAQCALQLYYSTSTAYIENVVLNECVGGFVSDSQDGRYDVVYNFKGFVDVLNYMSFSGLADSINQQVGMMALLGFDAEIMKNEQYLEWFGKTPNTIVSITNGREPWLTSRFFNVFLYNRYKTEQNSTLTIKYWNNNAQQYQTKEEGGAFDNGVSLATPIDQEAVMDGFLKMGYYRVFVYDNSVALDGGQKTGDSQYYNDRNMNELFSESRYIRLLCQYKTLDSDGQTPIKNYDHILWHTNRVYRDYSIIGEREDHIDNLKKSLEGTTWEDGSGVNSEGEPFDPPTEASNLLATALPERKQFAA